MLRQHLERLGLVSQRGTRASITPEELAFLESRTQAFSWAHMGYSPITLRQLLSVLESDPELRPPRTGHLGDWSDINRFASGVTDLNYPAQLHGRGYALIYSFNRTENSALTEGDCVYFPGSTVRNGLREPLTLTNLKGRELSRERCYFTPFVMTRHHTRLLPLTQFHHESLPPHCHEAVLIHKNWSVVQKMVQHLLEEASHSGAPKAEVQEIIGHLVTPDGQAERAYASVDGGRLRLHKLESYSVQEIAELACLPFTAVARPEDFFSRRDLPPYIPVLSNTLMRVLSAHIKSFRLKNVNLHYHWGALGMAGYPPLRQGYFANKTKKRYTRKFFSSLVAHSPHVSPCLFILLPASVFLLQASSHFPRDADLVDALLTEAHNIEDQNVLQTWTDTWLRTCGDQLSPSFLSRFSGTRVVLPTESGVPLESEAFLSLSLQRACSLVGCLHQAYTHLSKKENTSSQR